MREPPVLILRVDANPAIGAGHVMRCIALAQAWRAGGGRAVLCGRIESEFLGQRLVAEGLEYVEVEPGIDRTLEALRRKVPLGAWVAIDGYHFGPEWQDSLVEAGYRVIALDDGARLTRYRAHVILAAEHDATPSRYQAPSSTVILAGSRYRLLRQGFADMVRAPREHGCGAVVLVSFGGADSRNATCDALLGLSRTLGPTDRVLVVLGPLNRHEEAVAAVLRRAAFQHELYRAVEDMRDLYGRADLAVSAAGGAAWEMAVCGVPSILVPVAENQVPGMRYLVAAGAALNVENIATLRSEEFPQLVSALLSNHDALSDMRRNGQAACDGRGASRVCQVLRCLDHASECGKIVVRRAEHSDMEHVFRLANDRAVRTNSFSPEPISLADHARWFGERISSTRTAFYVMELEGVLAAVARFDAVDDTADADLAVHPAFRGRGLGSRMLKECAPLAASRLQVSCLRAVVFEQNAASRLSFLRGGFAESGMRNTRGRDCAIYEWRSISKGHQVA